MAPSRFPKLRIFTICFLIPAKMCRRGGLLSLSLIWHCFGRFVTFAIGFLNTTFGGPVRICGGLTFARVQDVPFQPLGSTDNIYFRERFLMRRL